MSNNEHNGAPDGTQAAQDDEFQDVGGPEATPEAEILPPEHAPTISWGAVEVTEEARAVNDLSLSWRHMTDDERLETIEGEMVLTVRSKRNLEDWIVIGRACLHLKHEVEEQGVVPVLGATTISPGGDWCHRTCRI